jgi:mono/diheme cytochrome c family protein
MNVRHVLAHFPLTQRYALGASRRLSRKRERGKKLARWFSFPRLRGKVAAGRMGGILAICAIALALAGCERGMHEMYDQPKYKPLTASPLWPDGNSSRPQVPGTQPYSAGALADVSSGRMNRVALVPPASPVTGVAANGKPLAQAGAAAAPGYSNPLPITLQLLARGQQRFDIYCAPCHSRAGDGDGMIAERGFPHPPSYHTAALRNAPDSHFYQVITDGYGVMYSYADRVSPHDRWAIVAYIRALQLSQHAPRSDLSAKDLARLSPIPTFPRKRGKEKTR